MRNEKVAVIWTATFITTTEVIYYYGQAELLLVVEDVPNEL